MYQAVHNAVGYAGIADLFVPVRHRQLTSENGRAALLAIIADLQKIATLLIFQGRHREIIQHQHVDAGQLQQQLADTAVGACYRQAPETVRPIFCEMPRSPPGKLCEPERRPAKFFRYPLDQ